MVSTGLLRGWFEHVDRRFVGRCLTPLGMPARDLASGGRGGVPVERGPRQPSSGGAPASEPHRVLT
jgi:hypothetical protein